MAEPAPLPTTLPEIVASLEERLARGFAALWRMERAGETDTPEYAHFLTFAIGEDGTDGLLDEYCVLDTLLQRETAPQQARLLGDEA